MPLSEEYVRDVDPDNETDPVLIAQKINSEISASKTYWQEFKELCTELYFDLLAFRETKTDTTRSNTFIPLSYVDIMVTKARLKRITTSAKPIARVKPVPYNADLSFRLSQFAHHLLQEADFEDFWDILVQDALTYPGAPFQVTWGMETKPLPAFWDIQLGEGMPPVRIPRFDPETGKRVFEEQVVRDGLILENIGIQDFYLPKNSKRVETDPWAAKVYTADLQTLYNARKPDGSPKYQNLERLGVFGETRRPDTAEQSRMGEPSKRDYPSRATFGKTWDIVEFVTRNKIYHVPSGCDFLISDPEEWNPYRQKPFHIARVEKLPNEPYGFCPNRANHLMTRTYNEIMDVVMDGLFKEDNKAFIINEDLVDDFEVGAEQGNLIHVHGLDGGMDVATAVKPIETRAYATEILPVLQMLDQIHQLTASRSNMAAGMVQQGAETAFENALIEQGESHRPLDMARNLVQTAMKPIYLDMFHLAKINYVTAKSSEILDDNGQLIQEITVMPQEVYGDVQFDFEFLDKERKRMEERAAIINLMQVWGNMVNVDPVSVLLMKNLLINSGVSDTAAIQKALDQSVMQRQLIQLIELQMQQREAAAQENRANQANKKPSKESSTQKSTHKAGNTVSTTKTAGV